MTTKSGQGHRKYNRSKKARVNQSPAANVTGTPPVAAASLATPPRVSPAPAAKPAPVPSPYLASELRKSIILSVVMVIIIVVLSRIL